MLKSVLYSILLLTTTVRFADIVYILTKDVTNLPAPVLVVTTAMVLYGIVLSFKRFFSTIRLKQFMTFFLVQSAMIGFNLVYMSITSPLQITGAETLIVGTFLDLIINFGILYFCTKQVRGGLVAAAHYN